MADVYIDTMEQDATLLKTLLFTDSPDLPATLSVVHKIKGSATQIGLRTIGQSATYAEKVGKMESADYPCALSSLVREIQQSIIDVKHWKSHNTKKGKSAKVYCY
ncbi:Hpt domain-containing protein [Vibrio sp. EA2]|uniref:Hpt domain-containing protein n=1 Tax=Vibrio sp. EA2 TaxID=3079860 RepID=UPI00294A4BCA|nr:Hpt domain-containing protein [Vibrio sp. EA2]MDV6250039.1 Hpt domain-containing protein [Vibrio sp. EA2]